MVIQSGRLRGWLRFGLPVIGYWLILKNWTETFFGRRRSSLLDYTIETIRYLPSNCCSSCVAKYGHHGRITYNYSGGQVSCLMCTITLYTAPLPFIRFIPRWREWPRIAIQACITADVGHDVTISLSRDWDSASESGHNLAVFSTATQVLVPGTILSNHVARRTNCSEMFRPWGSSSLIETVRCPRELYSSGRFCN